VSATFSVDIGCAGSAAVEVIGAALDVEGGADADEVRMRVGEGRTSPREGAVGTRDTELGAVEVMGASGAAAGAVGREGDGAQGERDSVDTKMEALDITIAVGVDGIEAGTATSGVGMLGTEAAGAEERLSRGCASVEGCERRDVPPRALTSDQQSLRRGRANLPRLYELQLRIETHIRQHSNSCEMTHKWHCYSPSFWFGLLIHRQGAAMTRVSLRCGLRSSSCGRLY
jgi:hypothetical protein